MGVELHGVLDVCGLDVTGEGHDPRPLAHGLEGGLGPLKEGGELPTDPGSSVKDVSRTAPATVPNQEMVVLKNNKTTVSTLNNTSAQ